MIKLALYMRSKCLFIHKFLSWFLIMWKLMTGFNILGCVSYSAVQRKKRPDRARQHQVHHWQVRWAFWLILITAQQLGGKSIKDCMKKKMRLHWKTFRLNFWLYKAKSWFINESFDVKAIFTLLLETRLV